MALKPRVTVQDILEYLNVPRSTFNKWRKRGVGPTMGSLPNGTLWCYECEFEAWLDQERAA